MLCTNVRMNLFFLVLLVFIFSPTRAFAKSPSQDVSSSESCKECHPILYREWLGSPHSSAFTAPEFNYETNGYRAEFCLPCHIPQGFMGFPKELKARSVYKNEGVGCPACHMLGDVLQSNTEKPTKAHPKRAKNPFFTRSVVCAPCHKTNYIEVGKFKVAKPKTCQDCHMPGVKRKSDKPIKKYQLKTQDHRFSVFKRKSYKEVISMNIEKAERVETGVSVVVNIENIGAYHALPSSDFGYNEFVVTAELKNEMGLGVSQRYFSVLVERKNAFQPREKKKYPILLSDPEHQGVRLYVRLLKVSFDRKRKTMLLNSERDVR